MKNFPESMRPMPKPAAVKCEQEYYNDLPGKIPPELSNTKSPKAEKRRERVSSNLIDLETPLDYVNDKQAEDSDDDLFGDAASSELKEFFEFCKIDFIFFTDLPESSLKSEKWFHGSISRVLAESLLKNDGDFLVRESQNTRGQFVLTGMKV